MLIKNKVAIYAIIIIIIAATAAAGVIFIVYNQNKTKGYVKTNATVVGYNKKVEYDSDYINNEKIMYQEIVEFVVDGVKYSAENHVWSNTPKSKGSKIEVAYDPKNPKNCVFVKSQNFISLILFIISGGFLIALIAQILNDRKIKRGKNDDNKNTLIA